MDSDTPVDFHDIRCRAWHRRVVEIAKVFTAAMIEAHCPECTELVAFEQPPCVDGHGAECPEWACLTCGTALWIGAPVKPLQQPTRTSGSLAA
jgi:phage FluMu protein Com